MLQAACCLQGQVTEVAGYDVDVLYANEYAAAQLEQQQQQQQQSDDAAAGYDVQPASQPAPEDRGDSDAMEVDGNGLAPAFEQPQVKARHQKQACCDMSGCLCCVAFRWTVLLSQSCTSSNARAAAFCCIVAYAGPSHTSGLPLLLDCFAVTQECCCDVGFSLCTCLYEACCPNQTCHAALNCCSHGHCVCVCVWHCYCCVRSNPGRIGCIRCLKSVEAVIGVKPRCCISSQCWLCSSVHCVAAAAAAAAV